MSSPQNQHNTSDNDGPDVTIARSALTVQYSSPGQFPSGEFTPGSRLNGMFRIEKQLGRGGMGEAWKAYDETADRYVVLKFVPKEIQHVQAVVDSVRDSFRKVHELQHQHICPVYGLFTDPDYGLYLAMKFIDGMPLNVYKHKLLEKTGKMSFSNVVQILWSIAKGLDYAHEKKVIHRDIKPQNVMLSKKDGVQIIDFGLAEEIRTSMAQFSEVTMEVSGTRPYMAPEQWRGRFQDARTDQYALAVTAYELLAGYPPFYGSDVAVLRECVLNDEPEPIADLPKHVNAVLFKALAKKREDRFSDCKSFIKSLAEKPKEDIVEEYVPLSVVPHLLSDRNTNGVQPPVWKPQTVNSTKLESVQVSIDPSLQNPPQRTVRFVFGKPFILASVAVLITVLGLAGLFVTILSPPKQDVAQLEHVAMKTNHTTDTEKKTENIQGVQSADNEEDKNETAVINTEINAEKPTDEIKQADWVSLFNGINLDGWKNTGNENSNWRVGNLKADATTFESLPLSENQADSSSVGCMIHIWGSKGVDIYTEKKYGDCTLKLDFLIPKGADSGIYLMGAYEVQIVDSFGKSTDDELVDIMGSIISAAKASTNACAAPGTWQIIEIDFVAPKFDAEGNKTANALFKKITLNGQVVNENAEIYGPTSGGLTMTEAAVGPLMLQGSHCNVAFRNIKIKENKTENIKINDFISALKEGTVDDVKFFLDRGDNLDVEAFRSQLPPIARYEAQGVAPIHIAAWFNSNIDVVKYLVSHGTGPQTPNKSGAQVIQYAARNPNVEVLKYFISLGSDSQVKDNPYIFLDAACYNTNIEVLKYLLAHGANIDSRGWMMCTPLHVAVQRNPNSEVMKFLISQGADVNAKDDDGKTPLDLADTEEKKQILREKIGKALEPAS